MSRARLPNRRGHELLDFEHSGIKYTLGAGRFEDAIKEGLARASKTIRNIKSAWVKEQTVRVEKGKITEFQVNLLVTFVLE